MKFSINEWESERWYHCDIEMTPKMRGHSTREKAREEAILYAKRMRNDLEELIHTLEYAEPDRRICCCAEAEYTHPPTEGEVSRPPVARHFTVYDDEPVIAESIGDPFQNDPPCNTTPEANTPPPNCIPTNSLDDITWNELCDIYNEAETRRMTEQRNVARNSWYAGVNTSDYITISDLHDGTNARNR